MLNYMIIFKECFRIAQLIRFKFYSFMIPFPNIEVPGWGVTALTGKIFKYQLSVGIVSDLWNITRSNIWMIFPIHY